MRATRALAAAASALLCAALSAAPARALQAAPVSSGTALGVSSITWTWSLAAGATGYRILSSTTPGLNISGDLPATAASFTLLGLSTNTPTTVTVEAFGLGGVGDALSSVYTAAAQPSGTIVLGTIGSQVSLEWNPNGNPAGTNYQVSWSTPGGAPVVYSTQPSLGLTPGASVSATVPALPASQTVSFQVQAVNNDGFATDYDVSVATTLPALWGQPVISSATFAQGISSITWYWSASTGAVAYQLFNATNGAISPLLGAAAGNFTQTGLTVNSSNTIYVAAYGLSSSTNSAAFTRYTLAKPTTGLTATGLANAYETLSWAANGNPAGTAYNVKWWSSAVSTVTISSAATTAVAGQLPAGGTVYFTVQAQNGDGVLADFDATLYTATPSTSFPTFSQSLPAGYSGVLHFVTPTAAVSLTFSSATFPVPATVSVSSPASAAPAFGSGQIAVSPAVSVQITALDGFGNALQPLLPVGIHIDYLSGSFGTLDPSKAVIARYDAGRGVWLPLVTMRNGNGLYATTDHLSLFAVLGVAAPGDFTAITVGPNPLRPMLNPGAVMAFRGMPSGARVRIFTYRGERLADLLADGAGIAAWDGRNAAGSFVASGVYIAVIEGAGDKKIMRVAVER